MISNKISFFGLVVEAIGFILIWRFGGLDGALARIQIKLEETKKNIERLNELITYNNKSSFTQTISRDSNGIPAMGMLMPNTELSIYLSNELARAKNTYSSLEEDLKKRKWKYIYEQSKGTGAGFILVMIGLCFQLKAMIIFSN